MGIEGLLQVLKPITKKTHIRNFANKTAAVDASAWIYKGAYSCSWELSQGLNTNAYLHFPFHMIRLLQAHSITPILVFDGLTLPFKEGTAKKRLQEKKKNRDLGDKYLKEGNIENAKVMYSRSMFIRSSMTYKLIDLVNYLQIKYIVAPYEADAQIAYLCKQKIADFAISEDSDILVYGCEDLVLKLDYEGNCENITLQKTLSDPELFFCTKDEFVKDLTEFSTDQFIELCIIAGCDYLKNIPGIGLKRAIKYLKGSTLEDALEMINGRGAHQGKVPESYLEDVQRIKLQFLHGWVIDTENMVMTRFSPLPVGHKLNLSGLGEEFPEEIVPDYALGLYNAKKGEKRERIDPAELEKTKKELETFRVTKPPSNQVSPPNGSKATVATNLQVVKNEILAITGESADPKEVIDLIHKFDADAPLENGVNVNGIHADEEGPKPEIEEEKKPEEPPKDRLREEMRIIMAERRKAAEAKKRQQAEQEEQIEEFAETKGNKNTGIVPSRIKQAKVVEDEDNEEEMKKESLLDEQEKRIRNLLSQGIRELDKFFGQRERLPKDDIFPINKQIVLTVTTSLF
eukprot:TRINITY_DN171_c0_g1_i2.p2 TRINITY_DN171_c0_g1~~TRINITY_DN171_c0_g1_i2.p2  ORF type:complete len:573 (+),score=87.53 TRINITY_DN171_c0_g1_i2:1363-3081(+)